MLRIREEKYRMISGIAYGLLLLSFIWLLVLIIGIYVLIRVPHKEIGYINWIKKLMVVLYNTVSSFWDIYLNWIIDHPKKNGSMQNVVGCPNVVNS